MKKKFLSAMTSALMLATLPMSLPGSAAVTPNPVISRNCPAYSGTNPATAVAGNDDYYYSFWQGAAPDDYLAYDLSGVPEENRKIIDAVWYNTSAYDVIGLYINRNMEPSDYTIEINAADGGDYPETGWEIVETVTGNTLSSRQHIVNFEGYNWIRLHITGVDEKTEGNCMVNFDIHDVSEGISDSWIFYGDSITAGGMNNCFGTGFATYINRLDANYFPVQENGGIGGITSTDGLNNIDKWLSVFPGRYVSIAYGTNDAWGNQSGAQKYYENTVAMIQKVLEAGKIPVLPKIPHAEEPGVADYLDDYNAMIDKIYEEFPEVIKGPDFDAVMKEHPEYLSSDGVHPNSEGYEEMRRIWAETMYQNVYTAGSESSSVKGDVNQDGKCSVADIIKLQKYLLGREKLADWQSADLTEDQMINIYDLIALKRLLLS
ncbi:MAG: lysophospholipase [Oscillospiraceae bacterium]|nr:lysophospholipase [Oscillospiraceae bacterium]